MGKQALLLAPAVWVATEMARTYSPLDFPWDLLGYSQATVLPIAQLASVGRRVWPLRCSSRRSAPRRRMRCSTRRRAAGGSAASSRCSSSAPAIWGTLRIRTHALTSEGTPVRVAVLQGNIPQEQKWDPAMGDAIMDRYIGMTREAILRNAQFVIWPESATPLPYEQDVRRGDLIRRLARQAQITMLIGSDQIEPVAAAPLAPASDGRASPAMYNAAYLVRPDGSTAAVYRKIHLVPFGEYVPFSRLLFFLGPLVDFEFPFVPGTEATLLPVEGHMVSTAICYEVIYAGLMRSFVTRGSELLTTITNDAWYGWSSAAFQHWEQASLRAIEEGRYLARAANTGISGFVDPYGRVMQRSNMFQSAVMAEDLRFLTSRTIYVRIGNVAGWASVALTLAALAATTRRRRAA